MTKILGITEGGTPFEPLRPGNRVRDEDGDAWTFDRYGITGWFGFFTRDGSTIEHKLPLAGLEIVEVAK